MAYPKYKTPKELKKAITKYFNYCDKVDKPYTISGLSLALGFLSREALLSYNNKEKMGSIVKEAKLKILRSYEEQLIIRKSGATGLIFILKNNFNWKDRQEFTGADGTPLTINLIKFTNLPINENIKVKSLSS